MNESKTPETDAGYKAHYAEHENNRKLCERLERERDEALKALRELVRLKSLHDEIEFLHDTGTRLHKQKSEEYQRCKPLAWDRARAILAKHEAKA